MSAARSCTWRSRPGCDDAAVSVSAFASTGWTMAGTIAAAPSTSRERGSVSSEGAASAVPEIAAATTTAKATERRRREGGDGESSNGHRRAG